MGSGREEGESRHHKADMHKARDLLDEPPMYRTLLVSQSLTRPSSTPFGFHAASPAAPRTASRVSSEQSVTAQIPVRRKGSSVAASGPLDAGRLALARSHYEDRRAAAAATRFASEVGSASAAAASRSAAAACFTPVSGQARSVKRRRESSDDEADNRNNTQGDDSMLDNGNEQVSGNAVTPPSAKRKKVIHNQSTPVIRRGISAELPPLETAAGNPVETNTNRPSAMLLTSQSEPPSAPSSVPSSPAPASSSQPVTPVASSSGPIAGVDLRQKTRNMLEHAMRDAASMPDPSIAHPAVKCEPNVEQIETALATVPTIHVHTFSSLAVEIESMMLLVCGSQLGTAYRQRLRSLLFNMRRNPTLTHRLLRGTLTAYQLSQLSEEELADPQTQAEREALKAENLSAAMSRTAQRMETHDFKCPQCGSNQCSTRVIREERDISKADTWGSKQGAGSVIDILCQQCKHTWTKEE